MIVGYARVSTAHQGAGLAAQKEALERAGCEKVFDEEVSSIAERGELDRALEFVREGDVLVVTKLDRLARSVAHLCQITAGLESKGVQLKILDMGLDTSGTVGRLFLNIIGAIAQFERENMLERQKIGIAAAKAAGKYKGRNPGARNRAPAIRELAAQGVTKIEIAKALKISERSVYRVLGEAA
jgi:DNA invertase Pin-like site-specific DNA recombinase